MIIITHRDSAASMSHRIHLHHFTSFACIKTSMYHNGNSGPNHLIYNLIQPTQTHCTTCGISPNPKVCPNPTVIQKYLEENAGYDDHIAENEGMLCMLPVILKRITRGEITSTDTNLKGIIKSITEAMPLSYQYPSFISSSDEFPDSLADTALLDGSYKHISFGW